eukprot:scaffold1768_cov116-Isochrysis_galbana.AAC.3
MPTLARIRHADALNNMLTPHARAAGLDSDFTARWQATSDAEHAVSIDTQAPLRSKQKESLPTATEHPDAESANKLVPALLLRSTPSVYSLAHMPRKTPVRVPARSGRRKPAPCNAA